MKRSSIYKITGVALIALYVILVCVFANSETIKNNSSFEIFLPFVLAFCLFGGVVFLILGLKKNKKDNDYEMTEEIAHNIITKVDKIKKFALMILGVGVIFTLVGFFSNKEMIAKIGMVFWIVGVFIGIFSKEGKRYKMAKKYIDCNKTDTLHASNLRTNNYSKENKTAKTQYDNLMTSQFPALYLSKQDNTYKRIYFKKLRQIGFNNTEAEKMFDFECDTIKRFNKQYLQNPKFTQMWFFGLKQPFFLQYPKTKADILKEAFFTISEICKMIDEAEWHFWNSHEKNLSDEVFREINEWRIKGAGMEFAIKYFEMIEEKTGIASEKISNLVSLQGEHLSKFKW